jgi:hypothetical protein
MNKTKNIVTFGVLIALYVALSFCMKFTVIGNIQIDLGYVVFAVACCIFGAWGFVVGAFGCMIESILFSAYGFSISWFIANVIIGILCGTTYMAFKEKHFVWRMFFTLIAVLLGVGVFKTGIECYLYNIPLAVKLPKNIVATIIDTIAMWIGLWIYPMIKKNIR